MAIILKLKLIINDRFFKNFTYARHFLRAYFYFIILSIAYCILLNVTFKLFEYKSFSIRRNANKFSKLYQVNKSSKFENKLHHLTLIHRISRQENDTKKQLLDVEKLIKILNQAKLKPNNSTMKHCPIISNACKGALDVKKIIKNAGLDENIQFFDDFQEIKLKEKNQDMFYLNLSQKEKTKTNLNIINEIVLVNEEIETGGHWLPKDCISRFKTAIIIPYLNRFEQLKVVLYYLNILMQVQKIDYQIFIIEPANNQNETSKALFNRGLLYNIGFTEALKLVPNIECIIFHDVDLLPEDDRNIYTCSNNPRHLSVAIDKFNYALPYKYLVGGVLAIKTDQYRLINGYSNSFWGWGGEDDDLYNRMRLKGLRIERPPESLARFRMLRHNLQALNPHRLKLLRLSKRLHNSNGLSSLKYKNLTTSFYKSFTHFSVELGESGQ